jgi:hypothetical protein
MIVSCPMVYGRCYRVEYPSIGVHQKIITPSISSKNNIAVGLEKYMVGHITIKPGGNRRLDVLAIDFMLWVDGQNHPTPTKYICKVTPGFFKIVKMIIND